MDQLPLNGIVGGLIVSFLGHYAQLDLSLGSRSPQAGRVLLGVLKFSGKGRSWLGIRVVLQTREGPEGIRLLRRTRSLRVVGDKADQRICDGRGDSVVTWWVSGLSEGGFKYQDWGNEGDLREGRSGPSVTLWIRLQGHGSQFLEKLRGLHQWSKLAPLLQWSESDATRWTRACGIWFGIPNQSTKILFLFFTPRAPKYTLRIPDHNL